ncbi:MAG: response regulator [Bacteroidota bacterium]
MVRSGLAALVRNESDMEVVAEACDGMEAVEKARQRSPQVVLMDINMPRMDGIEATALITQGNHPPRVLVLTQFEHEEYIKRVVQSGASGYILKNSVVEDLRAAIRALARGEQYFAPKVSQLMVESYVRTATDERNGTQITLTNRETQILHHIVDGLSNLDISGKLHISVRTVEFHRANLTEKIGVRDTVGLVKYALQKRLLEFGLPEHSTE